MAEEAIPRHVEFKCERCGRTGGGEILKCPKRPRSDCPYERTSPSRVGMRFVSGGFALAAAFWTVGWVRQQGPDLSVGELLATLVCLPFLLIGLYGLLVTSTQLRNPVSGLKWTRRSLFGYRLNQTLLTPGKLPSMDLELSRPLPMPASISVLQENDRLLGGVEMFEAVAVFRAAIVTLLAEGQLQVYIGQEYGARLGEELAFRKTIYTISLTGSTKSTQTRGALERIIISDLRKDPERQQTSTGLSIYELVRNVYGKDVNSPAKHVISIAVSDAASRGLGRRTGLLNQDFKFYETRREEIRAARSEVWDLQSQLRHRQPEFYGALGEELERAIKSRQQKETVDTW